MPYSQSSQNNSYSTHYQNDDGRKVTQEFNPFDVPFEVILHELNFLAREFSLTPLQSLLLEGFEDVDDLRAAISELSDKQLARRIMAEIDMIIDEYRKRVTLL